MLIDEVAFTRAMTDKLDPYQVGWFAARQPGILRFLELACPSDDALAVALDAAWRICALFERVDRIPPPRVARSALAAAETTVVVESATSVPPTRQPALIAWIADRLADSPLPLTDGEKRVVGTCLCAVVTAVDELRA
jgi:hypothetical protein